MSCRVEAFVPCYPPFCAGHVSNQLCLIVALVLSQRMIQGDFFCFIWEDGVMWGNGVGDFLCEHQGWGENSLWFSGEFVLEMGVNLVWKLDEFVLEMGGISSTNLGR